ncbi:MAG: hypothetical protein QOF73_451 [Thermomicrobiales bacterium]|nr:hypothetical protein [Thermomicrobiales bacterium]
MTKHELIRAYVAGRIGRRDFVRNLTALGVSGAAATAYAQSLAPAASAAGVRRDAQGLIVRAQQADDSYGGIDLGELIELIRRLLRLIQLLLALLDELLAGLNVKVALQTADDLEQNDLDELATLRTQLAQHRDALRTLLRDLGGDLPADPSVTGGADATQTLGDLALLLNGLVAVFAAVIPGIAGSDEKAVALRRTLTSIALVEARQAAFVNRLLGEPAFPETFEQEATPDEIDDLIAELGG